MLNTLEKIATAASEQGTLEAVQDVIDSEDGFTWNLALATCESRTIRYSVDYSPLLALILLVFALWYIFFRMRTVRLKKIILQKQTVEKGTEFTVGVDLKTYVKVKDVEVRDFVPALFDVKEVPGVKPVKHKTAAGTELIWRFAQLYPYEERVLSYKIVPNFSITGHVTLPRSSVSFGHFGRKISRKSDATTIGLHMMKGTADLDQTIKQGVGRVTQIPTKFKTSGLSSDITYAQDKLGKQTQKHAKKARKALKGIFKRKKKEDKEEVGYSPQPDSE